MCKKILNVVKNVVVNGSVIIFDSTKSDELKNVVKLVTQHLALPTISFNYCLDANECSLPSDSGGTNGYYVSVSECSYAHAAIDFDEEFLFHNSSFIFPWHDLN